MKKVITVIGLALVMIVGTIGIAGHSKNVDFSKQELADIYVCQRYGEDHEAGQVHTRDGSDYMYFEVTGTNHAFSITPSSIIDYVVNGNS